MKREYYRFDSIQSLRCLAVLLVVFFHVILIAKKYITNGEVFSEFFKFGMFGVDLFFVVSGFVMISVTRGKFKDKIQAFDFLYRRISRIYPTYWFYTILVLIVFCFRPSWVNNSQGNHADIIASFLLFPAQSLPLVMVGWTLIHEMYFYLIFFVILLFVKEENVCLAIMLWGVFVIIFNLYFDTSDPIINLISHPMTFEFIAGCISGLIFYKIEIKVPSVLYVSIGCISLILSIFLYIYYCNFFHNFEPGGWYRVFIFGIPSMFIVCLFANAERCGLCIYSFFVKIGNASYSIYLSHVLTLSAFGRVMNTSYAKSMLSDYVMIAILFIFSIILGISGYYLVEKPLLKFSRKIVIGQR